MRYVQYYNYNTSYKGSTPELVSALGTDGVLPLDARYSLDNSIDQARNASIVKFKKQFKAFKIIEANNYREDGRELTELLYIM